MRNTHKTVLHGFMLLQREQLTIYFPFFFFNICTRDISSRLSPAPYVFPYIAPFTFKHRCLDKQRKKARGRLSRTPVTEKQMREQHFRRAHSRITTGAPAGKQLSASAPTNK